MAHISEFRLDTPKEGFVDITSQVLDAIAKSGMTVGIAAVYCPHTTAI